LTSRPAYIGKSELTGSLTGKIKTKRLPIGCRKTKPDHFCKYLAQGCFLFCGMIFREIPTATMTVPQTALNTSSGELFLLPAPCSPGDEQRGEF
jgi:hypothetical protein